MYITYNSVSIPTPWAVAGPHGQLASRIWLQNPITWRRLLQYFSQNPRWIHYFDIRLLNPFFSEISCLACNFGKRYLWVRHGPKPASASRSRLFWGQGFGFGFLDFWEPGFGFGFVIFKGFGFGFGFMVYQSLYFANRWNRIHLDSDSRNLNSDPGSDSKCLDSYLVLYK